MSRIKHYVKARGKNGTFSTHIKDVELVEKMREHCKLTNQQCTAFVENCVRKCLDNAYEEYLLTLPKEDLVKMITEKSN